MTEEEKKIYQENMGKSTKAILEAWANSMINDIKNPKKRQANDYICKDCDKCIFYDEYHDMGATEHLCQAHKPYDFYNSQHTMSWISACDCAASEELNQFYWRTCKDFVPKRKLINKALKKISKE